MYTDIPHSHIIISRKSLIIEDDHLFKKSKGNKLTNFRFLVFPLYIMFEFNSIRGICF
jgi:hypothetical protein